MKRPVWKIQTLRTVLTATIAIQMLHGTGGFLEGAVKLRGPVVAGLSAPTANIIHLWYWTASEMADCSVCGKSFIPAPQHMYRAKGKIQCSYTCYRKAGGDSGVYGKGLDDKDRQLLSPVREKTKKWEVKRGRHGRSLSKEVQRRTLEPEKIVPLFVFTNQIWYCIIQSSNSVSSKSILRWILLGTLSLEK